MIPDHVYDRRKVAFLFPEVGYNLHDALCDLQEKPFACLKPGYKNILGVLSGRGLHVQIGGYRITRKTTDRNKQTIVVFNINSDLFYGERPATFRDLQGDFLNEVEILGGRLLSCGETMPPINHSFTKSHTLLFDDPKTYQRFCTRLYKTIGKDKWRVSRHISRKLRSYVRDKERAEKRNWQITNPIYLGIFGLPRGHDYRGLRSNTRIKFAEQKGVYVTFYLHDDVDSAILDREYFLMKLKDAKRKA
jgi:hypothetical protein